MKMVKLKGLGVFFLAMMTLNIHSQKVYDLVVAQDGTGDYQFINSAISKTSNSRKKIFIKNGTYKEKVLIDVNKKNVHLIGESVDGVIITYDDYSGKTSGMTTATSYTVKIDADGFYAENITFENTATAAQAVAIYTTSDTIAFKNCKFLGYQDTHYADKGRQYYLNCETRGDVDFIFGSAAAFYDHSKIISRKRQGGHITAPSETVIKSTITGGTLYHGILFKDCILSAESGLADNSCDLGRPWGPYSSSVYINCEMGSHIKPIGWSTWENDNHLTAYFAEYNSKQPGSGLLDVSQRADWSKQLTEADTSYYSLSFYFKGWDPLKKTTALAPPTNPIIIGDSVKWDKVDNARGYVIIRNDSVIGFSATTSFFNNGIYGSYKIKTVSTYGAMSEPSSLATGIENTITRNNYQIRFIDGELFTPEYKEIIIYDITGKQVRSDISNNNISLQNLKNGIYIARIKLKDNYLLTYKFYKN